MLTISLLEKLLNLSSLQHETLTQNIANANTPGYKTKTVKLPHNFKELVENSAFYKKINLLTTNVNHISASKNLVQSNFSIVEDFENLELKPNDNNVNLSSQALKLKQNEIFYNKLIKEYEEIYKIFNLVLNNNDSKI